MTAHSNSRLIVLINAFGLYERFRPSIPEGVRGWGAKGEMKLKTIRALAK